MRLFLVVPFIAALAATSVVHAEDLPKVQEGFGSLKVKSSAPVPDEVTETQGHALSREAAIVRGQTALLTYILQKKTHSKKTLSEAEIPSNELQDHIRGYVKGARPVKTEWIKKVCYVTLVLDKSELRSILRKN